MENFKRGDKIYATYHHTFNIDRPMLGVILCKHPIKKEHHFFNTKDGKGDWYWILCDGNELPSLFPGCCLRIQLPEIEMKEELKKALKYREEIYLPMIKRMRERNGMLK